MTAFLLQSYTWRLFHLLIYFSLFLFFNYSDILCICLKWRLTDISSVHKKKKSRVMLILCSSLISFLESSLYQFQWLQSECVGQLCSESASTYTILPLLIFWVSSLSCWKFHISIFLNSSPSWNTFSSQYLRNNLRNDF